jgi:phosphodiesterase/alkaline phosphatase D-like protein
MLNIVADANFQAYFEYGTTSGSYPDETSVANGTANVTLEFILNNLTMNTRYYYRLNYREGTSGAYTARPEYTFHTRRSVFSTFKFKITSDSHAMFNSRHQQAMLNANNDQPDFHFDLGNRFYTDGYTTQNQVNNAYLAYRPWCNTSVLR